MSFFHRLFQKYGDAGLYDKAEMTHEILKSNQKIWDAAYKAEKGECAWKDIPYVNPWTKVKNGV